MTCTPVLAAEDTETRTRKVRPVSRVTLALKPRALLIMRGRPLNPEPTKVTVCVRPAKIVPATRVTL